MNPNQWRSTVAPGVKPAPWTVIGVPGGAAGGRSSIVGELCAFTGFNEAAIDNIKRVEMSAIARALAGSQELQLNKRY